MSRGGAKWGGVSASSLKSVKDARKYLTSAIKVARKHMEIDLEQVADDAYAEAIIRVPVDTGRLEASVSIEVSKDKRRPGLLATAYAVDDETGEEYAQIQHEEYPRKRKPGATMYYLSIPVEKAGEEFMRRAQLTLEEWLDFK